MGWVAAGRGVGTIGQAEAGIAGPGVARAVYTRTRLALSRSSDTAWGPNAARAAAMNAGDGFAMRASRAAVTRGSTNSSSALRARLPSINDARDMSASVLACSSARPASVRSTSKTSLLAYGVVSSVL